MTPIEIVYKTMYNHFVKRDGYSESSHIIAGAATFLTNFFFLINCYCIINIFLNHSMLPSIGKGTGLVVIGLLMILNHYLLFGLLKFSKNGDSANSLFNIDRQTYLLGWRIFILNLILGLTIPVLWALLRD